MDSFKVQGKYGKELNDVRIFSVSKVSICSNHNFPKTAEHAVQTDKAALN